MQILMFDCEPDKTKCSLIMAFEGRNIETL
jgi:hypothetical protein